jgi:hypothetical protein
MDDLSLHVLDIAQNSIFAGAKKIVIRVEEDPDMDRMAIEVVDDGVGMGEAEAKAAQDPFTTSRKGKRVGLGLPLLAEAARNTGGDLELTSKPGQGTTIRVWFRFSHVDRQPLGDMTDTLMTLIAGCPDLILRYEHRRPGLDFVFDSSELREELGDVPITHPLILGGIRRALKDALKDD